MFTHSLNATPNNPEGERQLEFWLVQLNEHLNQSWASMRITEEVPNPFQPDFQIQDRKISLNTKLHFEKAIAELIAATDCAHECQRIWPTGQKILEKVISGIELFIKANRIQIQVQELLMQPDPIPRNLKRLEQLMAEGWKHAERANSIFMKGISHLEQATDYQFVWDTHAEDDLPF